MDGWMDKQIYRSICICIKLWIDNNLIFCFLACPDGFFGNDCAEKCNTECKGCDNVNGSCDSDCYPGWKGVFCNEGTYVLMHFEKKSQIQAIKLLLSAQSMFIFEIVYSESMHVNHIH